MSNTIAVSAWLPLPIIMGTHLTEDNASCYSNLLSLLGKSF